MSLVTASQHGTFILNAESVIKKIEEHDTEQTGAGAINEIKRDITRLNDMFSESHEILGKLYVLINQYKLVQQSTRVKLRAYKAKYSK